MASILKDLLNKSAVPTEEDIQKAIAECDAEIEILDEKVRIGRQLSDDLKAAQEAYEKLKATVFPKEEGVVPGDGWKKKSDVEKAIVYREIQGFGDRLEILNRGDVAVGRIVFIVAAALLIVSVILYLWMHAGSSDNSGSGQPSRRFAPERVIEMQKNLVHLQASATAGKVTNKDSARAAFIVPFDSLKSFVISYGGSLSPDVFLLMGKLGNDIERGNVQPATVDSLGRLLTAQVKSVAAGFFWISEPGKWFEIAIWAFWGTLVGILFYLTGRLSGEMFDRHEIPEMATEVIITPLVVVAIFFLFSFTGITVVDPRQSTIYEILGIAFILGFAIRRTVGLMDTIKRRLLPEPSTGG